MVGSRTTGRSPWPWGLTLSACTWFSTFGGLYAAEPAATEPPAQLERVPELGTPALQSVDVEIVRERYPNRAVKVERQVIRDEHGDFVNHGSWQMWDDNGKPVGRGQYRQGQRDGLWLRVFQAGEAPLLSGPWGDMFEAPFLASGMFVNGKLHGVWAIVDAQERPVISWQYEDDQRHGKSVWYFPNGQRWREANYRQGELDGRFSEWTLKGALLTEENYNEGRRRGSRIEWSKPNVKKTEAEYLFAREIIHTQEDWWLGESIVKVMGTEGKDVKHGSYKTWYDNGQLAMCGEFREDQPVGKFVWWHSNGQRAIEGDYIGGKQSGSWMWWYASGRRLIRGHYDGGIQTGKWSYWAEDGQPVESAVYSIHSNRLSASSPNTETDDHTADTSLAPVTLSSADDATTSVVLTSEGTIASGEEVSTPLLIPEPADSAPALLPQAKAHAAGMLRIRPAIRPRPPQE